MPCTFNVLSDLTFRIEKIAVFRALQLGDMLCIIPTVRAIRMALPKATITLIGLPWQKDFVTRFSNYFDEFVEFSGWPGLPEREWYPESCLAFVRDMQQRKFDLVVQMQGNGILTNSMCLLWNGRITAGLKKPFEPCPGEGIFIVSDDDCDHEIVRFQKLLAPLGIKEAGSSLEFNLTADELALFAHVARQLHLSEKRYVCLHPGARDPKRRWSTSKFASVANEIYNQGFEILITGSSQEVEIMDQVQREASVPTIHSVGELGDVSLGLLATFIKHSALLFSNDTGVSHIAAALKTPSVILFSPYSNQQRWAPLDRNLHKALSHAEAETPEYVIDRCLDQLRLNVKEFSQSETNQ
jgi:ADP-heptose:LPS heptosyltransferase